uniref:NADH-ubiquinone oxidoreductase chain 1 n=1 Tax=Hemiscolopendra marginata TaxID=943146 RepID=A0A646QFT2_9MYRI
MFLKFMYFILLLICVLISVAFLTLLERNILGYIQIRKGPNKVGYLGILQPFSDAIKLFIKENTYPTVSNFLPYYLCPIISMSLALFIWMIFPGNEGILNLNFGMLLMMCILSINVYPLMGCGWFSNSKYALLGCLRSIAQTISYEVSLAIVLVCLMLMSMGFNFKFLNEYQNIWYLLMFYPLFITWMIIMLAETNRTPFDFAEGESELVSGFNIEYSAGGFALIFMAEYSSILFMSMIISLLFFGGVTFSLFLKITFFSFIFIFIRGLLPRFRYDKLMYTAWKILLPLSLNYVCFIVSYLWIFEIFSEFNLF